MCWLSGEIDKLLSMSPRHRDLELGQSVNTKACFSFVFQFYLFIFVLLQDLLILMFWKDRQMNVPPYFYSQPLEDVQSLELPGLTIKDDLSGANHIA